MTRLMLGLLVGACALGDCHGQASSPTAPVPVLAELFTSEGCNSCPPADTILEMLSKEQPVPGVYVVGMSEHVTYWDRLGWKDPFGNARFTERQNMYAYRFNLDGPFTPQVVVDGTTQMIGSDSAKLKAALMDAGRAPKPQLNVTASINEQGALAAFGSGAGLQAGAAENAEMLWAVTEDALTVDVKRGENAKRTLRHSGVVRTLIARKINAAGAADGMREVIPMRSEWKREHLRLVAFVQAPKSKRVLSVGWAPVPARQ